MIVLVILAFTWLSAASGLIARTADAAFALSFFILFLPYVSSAFVPVATMPDWLRPVAAHQPITPIIDTRRGLLLDAEVGDSWWIAILWLVGILAASVLGASVLWRRSRR